MKTDLINDVIRDTTDKENISDGIFTLGELHSDRLALIVNLFTFINKIYTLQGSSSTLWIADLDHKGNSTHLHFHVGITIPGTKFNMGALVPNLVRNYFKELGAVIKIQAPQYPPLRDSLKVFDYGQ